MNISNLKHQLWSLRKRAKFAVPLSLDGLVMLVIELIAIKISLGAEWKKAIKSTSGLSRIVEQASSLQNTLRINTVKLDSVSKDEHMPGWLHELILFTDGLDTETSNRKTLALLLTELLGENLNESYNFTPGISIFLGELLNHYATERVLGVGAGVIDPLIRMQRPEERYLLVEVENELARLLSYIADEVIDVDSGSPFQGEAMANVRDAGPFSTALVSIPWNVKSIKGTDNWSYMSRFPVRPTSTESLYIQSVIETVDDRALFILPQSFLYKTAGSDLELKQQMVSTGSIEAIVQLPERIMTNTFTAPVLMVINNREPQGKVYMADLSASKAFGERGSDHYDNDELLRLAESVDSKAKSANSTFAEIAEIENEQFNLSVSRYLVSSIQSKLNHVFTAEKVAKLGDVADIQRAQAIKTVDISKSDAVVSEFYEITPSDIGVNGYIEVPGKLIFVPKEQIRRVDKQRVKPYDLLLVIKGGVGKVGRVPTDCRDNWIAGQSFVILRPQYDNEILDWSRFIYRYLSSGLAQALIKSRTVGASVKMIKMQDLADLAVVIPDEEEQIKMREKDAEIDVLYMQLNETIAQIEDKENSFFSYDMNEYLDERETD